MGRSLKKLNLTEIEKLVKPNFSHSELNLLQIVIFHCVRNKFSIDFCSLISDSSLSYFIEKLTEVDTDW